MGPVAHNKFEVVSWALAAPRRVEEEELGSGYDGGAQSEDAQPGALHPLLLIVGIELQREDDEDIDYGRAELVGIFYFVGEDLKARHRVVDEEHGHE